MYTTIKNRILINWMTMILLVVISTPGFEAAKENIFNFTDQNPFVVDRKIRAMARLTSDCLMDNEKPVVVSENINYKLIRYIHRSEKTSTISIAGSKLFVEDSYSAALKSKETYYGQHFYRFQWKSKGFLISSSSPAKLREQLDNLKNSRWWNSAGYFLLTSEDDSKTESCSNAYDFLSLAWLYELLSTVFLCQESDESLSIYSYNPYANTAPSPWTKVREIKGQKGHPWNLFKWRNHDGRIFDCKSIFFDKTKSLGGYPITTNAIAVSPLLYFDKNETGLKPYKGEDGWIMRDIWNFLEATIVDVPLPAGESILGWVDENGTFHGNLIDIASGKVEIGWNSMILQPVWRITTTYPHTVSTICFVTKDRGAIPWVIGLAYISDKWTKICLLFLFLFATAIFGYVDKRRYFLGFLNVLRISVSNSFLRPPKSDSLRIILCVLFFLPIITYSTLQGKILSLVRNPSHYANIDDIYDLPLKGFKIEGSLSFKNVLPMDKLGDIYDPVDKLNYCIQKLHRNEAVACAGQCSTLSVAATRDKNLHVALDRSDEYPNRFVAKPDWSLLDRFNEVLRRIVEAGLVRFYRNRGWNEESASSDFSENDSNDTAVVIHLRAFYYIFIGLAIGWTCAIIAFIYERFERRLKKLKTFKIRIIRV